MNATKIIIVGTVLATIIGLGVALGRWANEASKQTETRYADAIRVLQER